MSLFSLKPSRCTVFLKHDAAKIAALEKLVMAISTPGSPSYGLEMSISQIASLIGHSSSVLMLLQQHLLWSLRPETVAVEISPLRDAIFVDIPSHISFADSITQHPLVQTILCTKNSTEKRRRKSLQKRSASDDALVCDVNQRVNITSVTPDLVSFLYSVPKEKLDANFSDVRNRQAVGMIGWNDAQNVDLQRFFQLFSPEMAGKKPDPILEVGRKEEEDGDVYDLEGELDVEWIMSMGRVVATTFFESAFAQPIQWLAQVNTMQSDGLPRVLSYSAGLQFSPQERLQWDVELLKAAARRVTILVSSGDSGSGCNVFNETQLSFPDISPYVTAVGGTQLGNCSTQGDPVEVGWPGSTGGFNSNYGTPPWQQNAIQTYMQGKNYQRPPSSFFNSSARGIPDVALLSNCMVAVVAGDLTLGGGTSFASPAFAGMIALLNYHRLKAGKSTLGFINPLLYAHPEAFTDIVKGETGSGTIEDCYGYSCTPNWDPVTGLGSPKFDKLLKIVMDLP